MAINKKIYILILVGNTILKKGIKNIENIPAIISINMVSVLDFLMYLVLAL